MKAELLFRGQTECSKQMTLFVKYNTFVLFSNTACNVRDLFARKRFVLLLIRTIKQIFLETKICLGSLN